MRILVTGAAGFIGSHVAERLVRAGHRVVALDDLSGGFVDNVPKGAEFVQGGIGDRTLAESLFEKHSFDAVYHLAAYAAEGLSHFIKRFNYENNVGGGVNILTCAINRGVKLFVFTSSIAVYGAAQCPMTEDMKPSPEDSYGISKYALEMELEATRLMFGMPYVIFRPHNVYGERQNVADRYRNVIGIFIRQALSGEPMTIFGDGRQTRAFSHIDEVAPVIARAVETPGCWNQAFNIGADTPVEVIEIARQVSAALDIPMNVRHLDARKEVVHAFADHSKARRFFGPVESVPLEEGISRMVAWVRKHGIPKPTPTPPVEIFRNLPKSWQA